MKTIRLFTCGAFLIASFYYFSVSASADVIADALNAQQIADRFNAVNENTGLRFAFYEDCTQGRGAALYSGWGTEADTSAYSTSRGGDGMLLSFSIEPYAEHKSTVYRGTLDYDANTGLTKTTDGAALTVGAAYLYKLYAQGELESSMNGNGMTDDVRSDYLGSAIRFLMGTSHWDEWETNWNSNQFLQMLLQTSQTEDYWTALYNPGSYYSEIGDYSVFVLQTEAPRGEDQPITLYALYNPPENNFLYIANAEHISSATPEPATMLVLGIGIGGIAAIRRLRKR